MPDITSSTGDPAAAPIDRWKHLQMFTGYWTKDVAASDKLEPAMQLIHLNGIIKLGVHLIKGVELGIERDHFRFTVVSAIPLLKISEYYPLSGAWHKTMRRDMRRGRATGRVVPTSNGTIQLTYSWGEPFSGHGVDEFSIDQEGRLLLRTVAVVGSSTVEYQLVYRRKQS